ncbi:MAG: DUF262 domain-containing protein [Vampirovibrio sp.]
MNHQDLASEIVENRKKISGEQYPMSIGELSNLYRDGDIVINPKFQRFFRWDLLTKSRLVESIFLGLPIPPLFMYIDSDGRWEVIDGLQRLSTILEFMEVLDIQDSIDTEKLISSSGLLTGKYLSQLHELKWNTLSETLKRDFKRAKVNLYFLEKSTDIEVKFDLFDRLNTAGKSLSEQELRNCKLIEVSEKFYDWFEKVTTEEWFKKFFSYLKNEDFEIRQDQEIFSRWITFVYCDENEISNFKSQKFSQKEFVDTVLLRLAKKSLADHTTVTNIEDLARKTFETLNAFSNNEDEHIMKKPKNNMFIGLTALSRLAVFPISLAVKIKETPEYSVTPEKLREKAERYHNSDLLVKETISSVGRMLKGIESGKVLFSE